MVHKPFTRPYISGGVRLGGGLVDQSWYQKSPGFRFFVDRRAIGEGAKEAYNHVASR